MIWGWFRKKAPSAKAIEKQMLKAKEPYAQPEFRRMAMEKLLEWNTSESITAILQRFSVVVQSPYWDEEEKSWLVEELVKKGEVAKTALKNYLFSAQEVSHAIMALCELCENPTELNEALVAALAKRSPDDYRAASSKSELILALDASDLPGLVPIVWPYLNDHQDDVQCVAFGVILKRADMALLDQLKNILSENYRSARVLRMAAYELAKHKISIPDGFSLAPEVAEEFIVKNGQLKAKVPQR